MVKKQLFIFAIILGASFPSCCFRHPVVTIGSETVLKNPKYRLNYYLDERGAELIDTAAIYAHEGDYLKFYKNGDVIRGSFFYQPPSNSQSFQIHPNSVYRGKYEILDNYRIKMEYYTPGEPVPFTDGLLRIIRKGVIVGDTIKIKTNYGNVDYYIKVTDWK